MGRRKTGLRRVPGPGENPCESPRRDGHCDGPGIRPSHPACSSCQGSGRDASAHLSLMLQPERRGLAVDPDGHRPRPGLRCALPPARVRRRPRYLPHDLGPAPHVDSFTIVLSSPASFDRIQAITGMPNGDHRLRQGVLEVSTGYGRWQEVARFKMEWPMPRWMTVGWWPCGSVRPSTNLPTPCWPSANSCFGRMESRRCGSCPPWSG